MTAERAEGIGQCFAAMDSVRFGIQPGGVSARHTLVSPVLRGGIMSG